MKPRELDSGGGLAELVMVWGVSELVRFERAMSIINIAW